jgi:RHS repeat-associated protein
VVGLTNATGGTIASARYDAWGNKTATVGTLPQYGYTGREPDATGLIYYRARYYDPTQRRFTQRDPIGMVDGVNRYAYVGNNPINYTDPTGELILNAVGAGWGLVSGGISGGIAAYHTTSGSIMGTTLGLISGGLAGAAVGAVNPFGAVAAGQIAGGTVGGILGNIGNTTLSQAVNNQSIRPLENLTPGTVGISFLSGAAGAAGASAVRLGAGMINSGAAGTVAMIETIAGTSAARLSTSQVINPSGNVLRGAGAIAGGMASGTMKSSAGNQSLPTFMGSVNSAPGPGYGSGGAGVVRSK